MRICADLTFSAGWGTLPLERTVSGEKTRSTSLMNQILLLLMVAMLLYLFASFARQVTVSLERQKELEKVDQQVAAELEIREQLEADLAHALSSAAVDEWAHKNLWGPEGEVIVAPARDNEMLPRDSQMAPEDTERSDSPQNDWWDLFFGTP
jgi:cell division protein FtsL